MELLLRKAVLMAGPSSQLVEFYAEVPTDVLDFSSIKSGDTVKLASLDDIEQFISAGSFCLSREKAELHIQQFEKKSKPAFLPTPANAAVRQTLFEVVRRLTDYANAKVTIAFGFCCVSFFLCVSLKRGWFNALMLSVIAACRQAV